MSLMQNKKALIAVGGCVIAGAVVASVLAVGRASGASPGANPAAPTPTSLIGDVLSKINNSRLETASIGNGTVGVVVNQDGQPSTIWSAKLAGSAIAHELEAANLANPDQVSYSTPTGAGLADTNPDIVKPLIGEPPALTAGCGAAVAASASQAGVRIVSAQTIDVLGGACVLTLALPTAGTGEDYGSLIGETLAPIASDHLRPYLVTLVDSSGATQEVLGWIPGIGGDYGQGMMYLANQGSSG